MSKDNTWAGSLLQFDFPACSGSRLVDIASGGRCQVCTLKDPNLLLLTTGGNDVNFFEVVDSCIYHSRKEINYGPDYDDDQKREGRCAQQIDIAMKRIKNQDQGFPHQLNEMYKLLLASDQAKNNPDLRIYQTGYAHFFNIDKESGWCNNTKMLLVTGPKLSYEVRAAINELVEETNQVIQQVTASFKDRHVGYISITEKFSGHRFCEAGQHWWDLFFSGDVWYWNITPQIFQNPQLLDGTPGALVAATQKSVPWPGPLFQFNTSPGDSGNGIAQRSFHPKKAGYTAIKDAILAQLKADGVPLLGQVSG